LIRDPDDKTGAAIAFDFFRKVQEHSTLPFYRLHVKDRFKLNVCCSPSLPYFYAALPLGTHLIGTVEIDIRSIFDEQTARAL
jgi:hypothetical protein